jgi:hypothetical protein
VPNNHRPISPATSRIHPDNIGEKFIELDSEHFGSFGDDRTIRAGGESGLFPLLPDRFRFQVTRTLFEGRTRAHRRGNEPRQLVDGKKRLFEKAFRADIAAQTPTVGYDRPYQSSATRVPREYEEPWAQ